MRRFDWRVVAWATGAATALWSAMASCPSEARAAGFATQKFGGEEGTPLATNPTALYYNPAGIGFSEGFHFFFDDQIAFRHATYHHDLGPGDTSNPISGAGNVGTAKLFNVFTGPALGATAKFGNLALGVGAFVPFGGREHWATNPSVAGDTNDPLAVNGVQRWQSITGSLTFLYVTGGLAYKLGPLSVGVSGNFIESWVQFSRSQNTSGVQAPNDQSEGIANLSVNGANGSFGAGAMLEAIPDTLYLAASYQAQPGLGAQVLKGTFDLSSPDGGMFPTKHVTLTQTLPDVFRGGIRFRPSNTFEARVFGDYTRWSSFKSQCVALQGGSCIVYPDGADASGGFVVSNLVRNWKDTYGIRGGVSIWLNKGIELMIGGGYEIGASPNSTLDPSIADANNYQGSLGARFTIAHDLWLYTAYTQILYANRNNVGQSVYSTLQGVSEGGDTGGTYTQWVGFLDLSLEKQF